MTWFLIGWILGTPISDHFDKREACEGRAVLLREKGFSGKCVELDQVSSAVSWGTGSITISPADSYVFPHGVTVSPYAPN